ncbi:MULTISPECIES: DUF3037 domain-containing protein [unclassified Anabaena]|uniref:DUF3037 domain-containing protein n=1 Tax=unclassified Anabaena TaxID=2619674 RepID=UPI0009EF6172|nr:MULTISPECIES: DUF3037 domain-containing protein [unclassified Anabaena]
MASKYSVIQYVPDPVADERINIGVVAFNHNTVRVRFVKNWDRVRDFSWQNIQFLKDFAHDMEHEAKKGLLFSDDQFSGLSYEERILKIARGWINTIQFTEPRGSLNTVDELLEDISSIYLHERNPELYPKLKTRDRRTAKTVRIIGINVKYLKLVVKAGRKVN